MRAPGAAEEEADCEAEVRRGQHDHEEGHDELRELDVCSLGARGEEDGVEEHCGEREDADEPDALRHCEVRGLVGGEGREPRVVRCRELEHGGAAEGRPRVGAGLCFCVRGGTAGLGGAGEVGRGAICLAQRIHVVELGDCAGGLCGRRRPINPRGVALAIAFVVVSVLFVDALLLLVLVEAEAKHRKDRDDAQVHGDVDDATGLDVGEVANVEANPRYRRDVVLRHEREVREMAAAAQRRRRRGPVRTLDSNAAVGREAPQRVVEEDTAHAGVLVEAGRGLHGQTQRHVQLRALLRGAAAALEQCDGRHRGADVRVRAHGGEDVVCPRHGAQRVRVGGGGRVVAE
eukprot:PhM_4_TR18678/c1_g1_i1/m.71231